MEHREKNIQWHSYFARVMEKVCTKLDFLVEREQEVGKMPLKIDFIVIKKKDITYNALDIPYSYFSDFNIIEFKSRTDNFDWHDLYQLEVYGRLYGILKKIDRRNKIALWSVASHFTDKYRDSLLECNVNTEEIDRGFFKGIISGFNYYEMNLTDLPFKKEFYPFHIFSKNRENIKSLIEISIDNPGETETYKKEIMYLHSKFYREVLFMKLLNPLEAGCDEEGLKELFFEEPLGSIFFTKWVDEIIQKVGEDKIINKLGEDKVTKILLKKLGRKKLQELLDTLEDV